MLVNEKGSGNWVHNGNCNKYRNEGWGTRINDVDAIRKTSIWIERIVNDGAATWKGRSFVPIPADGTTSDRGQSMLVRKARKNEYARNESLECVD